MDRVCLGRAVDAVGFMSSAVCFGNVCFLEVWVRVSCWLLSTGARGQGLAVGGTEMKRTLVITQDVAAISEACAADRDARADTAGLGRGRERRCVAGCWFVARRWSAECACECPLDSGKAKGR